MQDVGPLVGFAGNEGLKLSDDLSAVGVRCDRCQLILHPTKAHVEASGSVDLAVEALGWRVLRECPEDGVLRGSTEHYCPSCPRNKHVALRRESNVRRSAEIIADMERSVALLLRRIS